MFVHITVTASASTAAAVIHDFHHGLVDRGGSRSSFVSPHHLAGM